MDPHLQDVLEQVKNEIARARDQASTPQQLVREAVDRPQPLDLWSLSPRELDQEMANRLTSLNGDIDIRPPARLASPRRLIGPLVGAAKRLIRWFISPYTNLFLDRQVRFNADLVAFHLATFIRCRHLEERLGLIEERLAALEEALEKTSAAPPPAAGR